MMPRVLKSPRAFSLDDDYSRSVYMEKSCPEWRVARLPELPWASHLFIHFLTKHGELLTCIRNKRLAWLVEWPGSIFCDGRVAFLIGPTFLHINTFAHQAGSTRWRRDNQSMRERCSLGQPGQLFFSYTLFKVDSVRRVSLLLAENKFSPFKRNLSFEDFLQFTLKTLPFYR